MTLKKYLIANVLTSCKISRFKLFCPCLNHALYSTLSEQTLETKMSIPKRYFINDMVEHQNTSESYVSQDEIKNNIMRIISQIEDNQPSEARHADGGLYVGIAGIAYMFLYLSKSPVFQDKRNDFLNKGLSYIKQSENYQNKKAIGDLADLTGFLLGGSGIQAVASSLYQNTGDKNAMKSSLARFNAASKKCKPINFLPYGGDEFLVGRAGYVAGAIWLNRAFESNVVPVDEIVAVCKAMFDSGCQYSKVHNSPSPLMYAYYETEYLGAAHGLSTILQMMISVPEFVQRYPETEETLKRTVDFMLSLQTPEGNFPCAMDELGRRARGQNDELVHWCHGAPGVFYLMAKAYLVWKDKRYLDSCLKCGELIWKKGLLKKGPGICHGVAGNGYVFLVLYRLTNDKQHLFKAEQFANFLFSKQFKSARTPDSPYSLYEGLAGTVCYLNDVLVPEKAAFPFLEIF